MSEAGGKKLLRRGVFALDLRIRRTLLIFGGGTWLAGGASVFVPGSSEPGGVALIVGGMICIVVAAIGVIPTRVSGSNWSVDLSDEIVAAVEDRPTEEREQIVHDILSSSADDDDGAVRLATQLQRGLLFEQQMVKRLIEVSRQHGKLHFDFATVPDAGIDGVLTVAGQKHVAVNMKYTAAPAAIRSALAQAERLLYSKKFDGYLLIVNGAVPATELRRIEKHKIWILEFEDLDQLPKYFEWAGWLES